MDEIYKFATELLNTKQIQSKWSFNLLNLPGVLFDFDLSLLTGEHLALPEASVERIRRKALLHFGSQ